MNQKSLYHLTYGVYLLSARESQKDNACIINTAVQVATNPTRISIAVIKGGLTHDMIASTGICTLTALTEDAPFSIFSHFGMQPGREVDKFADFPQIAREANGLIYLTQWASAYLTLKITESHDLGSHTLFIGEQIEGEVIGSGTHAELMETCGEYRHIAQTQMEVQTGKEVASSKISMRLSMSMARAMVSICF